MVRLSGMTRGYSGGGDRVPIMSHSKLCRRRTCSGWRLWQGRCQANRSRSPSSSSNLEILGSSLCLRDRERCPKDQGEAGRTPSFRACPRTHSRMAQRWTTSIMQTRRVLPGTPFPHCYLPLCSSLIRIYRVLHPRSLDCLCGAYQFWRKALPKSSPRPRAPRPPNLK